MYKRRDWLHVHGADGGQSSGSDSSDVSPASSQGMAPLGCCVTPTMKPFAQPRRDVRLERVHLLCAGGTDAADDDYSGDEAEATVTAGGKADQRRSEEDTDGDEDGSDAEDPDAAGSPWSTCGSCAER